jgi:hypothetical protein
MSGNTFGARMWTDAKQIAPMLPEPPSFIRCAACSALFWLKDADELGQIDPWEDRDGMAASAWGTLHEAVEPDSDGYFEALQDGRELKAEEERELRILAWWKYNDGFRFEPPAEPLQLSDHARQNLESLARLLDAEEPEERIMKAEVLRELGRFDDASSTLDLVTDPNFEWVVAFLRALCARQDPVVRELTQDFG